MNATLIRPVEKAFEHLGQIREHLTAIQNVAGDIDDTQLSRALDGALRANTVAMSRTAQLLNQARATGPHDADLDSHHVVEPRGG
jgi:hypothetical protein